MALLVVLALAGAFGDGPLSHAHISFPDGSTITLSRVMRSDNPERILLSGAAASATPVAKASADKRRMISPNAPVMWNPPGTTN